MAPVQSRGMAFYDLRGCASEVSLPDLLTGWIKRKKGILMMNETKDKSNTFTLIVKKNFNVGCMAYTETPTYPECEFMLNLNKMY